MKILSAEQIRALDAYTIEHKPIASVDLMERASRALFDWIVKRYNNNQRFNMICGPGNNGGDGLALARMLIDSGYWVETQIFQANKYSQDFSINLGRLREISTEITMINDVDELLLNEEEIIVDAIFGSGLDREVTGVYGEVIKEINGENNTVIAIDIPSGVFCDRMNSNPVKVKADYTLSFQVPKLAFMMPDNEEYVGSWEVLDIGLDKKRLGELSTAYRYTTTDSIESIVRKRTKFSHKGIHGHALVIAGSKGKMGAAELATMACLRTGVGLLTCHVPGCGYEIMQVACPEAMCLVDKETDMISDVSIPEKVNAIGIGPGLGTDDDTMEGFSKLLSEVDFPIVIDADALNLLSANPDLLNTVPKGSILTPHVGELERFTGKCTDSLERLEKAKALAQNNGVVLVLKGAHTAVCLPDGSVRFNSTGNPGMATGGSGDVLTGIITSLLAQGYSPENAAVIGVYMHGFAGDEMVKQSGEASLIASDIIKGIPNFYKNF